MIDTHAHLTKRFCDVVNEKVEIDAVILAASSIEDSKENIEKTKNNPKQFFAAIGIHPQCTDPENKSPIDDKLKLLEELVKNNNITAIGECGLDYSTPPPEEKERSRQEQEKIFRKQIELSKKYKLPLIIHARKAMDEVISILKEYKNLRGVFHCYTGGKKRIEKILELGNNWYFGIDGNLTYEEGLGEVVKNIPKDKLLLETDSPFLTPVPHRGKANRPDYVKYIYQQTAIIWGLDFKETEKIIDGNARKLFGI